MSIMRKITVALVGILIGCNSAMEKRNGIETEWSKDSLQIKRVFYDNVLQSEISFGKDGINKEGKALYYERGKLVRLAYYKRNKLVGSYIEYYNNGKPKLFICHDSYGDTLFLRSYDMEGNILKEQGSMATLGFLSEKGLEANRMVSYNSFIVDAPHTSVNVDNYFLYNDLRDTLYPIKELVSYGWIHSYFFKLSQPGKYKYRQVTLIRDSIKGKAYRMTDSLTTEFVWYRPIKKA